MSEHNPELTAFLRKVFQQQYDMLEAATNQQQLTRAVYGMLKATAVSFQEEKGDSIDKGQAMLKIALCTLIADAVDEGFQYETFPAIRSETLRRFHHNASQLLRDMAKEEKASE